MNLTLDQIAVILALSGMIIASVGLIVGSLALIKVLAIEASTHTVQLTPIDTAVDEYNKAYLKEQKSEEWATSSDSLRKQSEIFNEDIEKTMPEFASTDEDSEIISF